MPKSNLKKAAAQFGLAGIMVPLVILALLQLGPLMDFQIGDHSVDIWLWELLLILAPPAPFVMTPSSQAWDWVVPYALFFSLNAILYAGIGALAATLVPRIAWYLVFVVCVLLVMFFLSYEWFLIKWAFGALGNKAPESLFGAVRELRARYFLMAAAMVAPALLGWRAAQRRAVKSA